MEDAPTTDNIRGLCDAALGYRRGLRDVQCALRLYGRTLCGPMSSSSAVFVAADQVSVLLRRMRALGIAKMDPEISAQMASYPAHQAEFVRGYQAGYDTAVEIVANWGRTMNNPGARDAIGDAITRLETVRSQMIDQEGGTIKTLRARKFEI